MTGKHQRFASSVFAKSSFPFLSWHLEIELWSQSKSTRRSHHMHLYTLLTPPTHSSPTSGPHMQISQAVGVEPPLGRQPEALRIRTRRSGRSGTLTLAPSTGPCFGLGLPRCYTGRLFCLWPASELSKPRAPRTTNSFPLVGPWGTSFTSFLGRTQILLPDLRVHVNQLGNYTFPFPTFLSLAFQWNIYWCAPFTVHYVFWLQHSCILFEGSWKRELTTGSSPQNLNTPTISVQNKYHKHGIFNSHKQTRQHI